LKYHSNIEIESDCFNAQYLQVINLYLQCIVIIHHIGIYKYTNILEYIERLCSSRVLYILQDNTCEYIGISSHKQKERLRRLI